MATPLNLELAANMGLAPDGPASPEQLLIAIRADPTRRSPPRSPPSTPRWPPGSARPAPPQAVPQRTIGAALDELEGSALAIISVPGQYAVAEAADAIAAGRSVLIFSDGVPVEHEVALKRAAHDAGVLVMGPDCGTAIVSGVALGFANVVRPGPVGLVAASGTGAQQVSCLLDMAGVGVSHVLGVGGRDLSEAVGGLATLDALAALDADDGTERVVLVSKPPAPSVAAAVSAAAAELSRAGELRRPVAGDARPHRRRRGPAHRHGPRRAGLAVAARGRPRPPCPAPCSRASTPAARSPTRRCSWPPRCSATSAPTPR